MSSEAKAQERWSVMDIGYLLHTGLRKATDTKASAVVWNLLAMDEQRIDAAWGDYLNAVRNALFAQEIQTQDAIVRVGKGEALFTQEAVGALLAKAVEAIRWGEPAKGALRAGFELLEEWEWQNLATFIIQGLLDEDEGENN